MTVNGFKNDQFFGIAAAGEDGGRFSGNTYVVQGAANPPFIYPAREIITQDGHGKVTRVAMQRGYIRTLINSVAGTSVRIRKCAFQFNPQVLSTSVAMTQDVLNAYQIDVGQFAVPTAGNSNFLFQLFFDRSMELNNTNGTSRAASANRTGDPNTENIFSGENALDPSVIGVFRDIGELNAIIGAGLSYEQMEYAQQTTITQIKTQAFKDGLDPNTDAGVQKALSNVPSLVGPVNYGNTAFLIPQPVRAVFSALFMVEGFVTNIDINYTKFTTSMVPMQATVTLTMNAQYIGYAKRRTYVTDSLEAQVGAYADQQAAVQADVHGLTAALQAIAGSVHGGVEVVSGGTEVTAMATLSGGQGVLQATAAGGPSDLTVFFEIPNAIGTGSSGGAAAVFDPVQSYLNANVTSAISLLKAVSVAIYGPYSSNPRRAKTVFEGNQAQLVFYGLYVSNDTVWKHFVANNISGIDDPSGPELNTSVVGSSALDGTKWWVIDYIISASAGINGFTVTGNGRTTIYTKDLTTEVTATVPMRWTDNFAATTSFDTSTTTTTANSSNTVVTNTATSTPEPGSSSVVGKATRGPN